MFNTDDFEHITDDDDIIHTSPLQELSDDLLEDGIKTQMEDPYNAHVDFLEQFAEQYLESMDEIDQDDEHYNKNKDIAWNFYQKVLEMLDKRFGLDLDVEKLGSLSIEGSKNIAEGLYTFFILKYNRNISKYIIKLIIDNEEALADALRKKDKNQENVSFSSWSRKLKDPKYVYLISHVNEVIETVRTMDVDPSDFIEYFNLEKFEVAVVEYAIRNMIIIGDFVPFFVGIVFDGDVQNDVYDDIVGEVQHTLYKRYKSKEPLQVEIIEEPEDDLSEMDEE